MLPTILVVDDDIVDLKIMENFLASINLKCVIARNAEQGLLYYSKHKPKIIFLDLIMPKMSGIELMQLILEKDPEAFIVIFTGFASIETAVDAIKKGAYDYVTKPINTINLSLLVDRIIKAQNLVDERNLLHNKLDELFGYKNFIGDSEVVKKICQQIEQISAANSTVLITGESGTGKELCANAIHYSSKRKGKPFIKLNCAALPESIIESELFGHEKGSFTSAVNRRIGRFEYADGGTLFLDEIGDMPFSTQVKLLRILESQQFERIGGNETIKVDVRLIAATNKDLKAAVNKNEFRKDLYYRLNVINIHIPRLNDRKEDIFPLAQHYLKKFASQMNKPITKISAKALSILQTYSWPGNVRELVNSIERAVVFCKKNTLTESDLPPHIISEGDGRDENNSFPIMTLANAEKMLLLSALNETDWNLRRAAKILDIHRGTLYSKIEKHQIKKADIL